MDVISSPELVEYEPFREPVQQWFALRAARTLPDIHNWPMQTDALRPYRMVARLTHDPLNVQYGEVGQTLEALYGKPMHGRNLDQLYNDWFRKRAYKGYALASGERLPVYERRTFNTIIRKIGYHKLHLPFGTNGTDSDGAITYIIPMGNSFKKREHWEAIVKLTPWL